MSPVPLPLAGLELLAPIAHIRRLRRASESCKHACLYAMSPPHPSQQAHLAARSHSRTYGSPHLLQERVFGQAVSSEVCFLANARCRRSSMVMDRCFPVSLLSLGSSAWLCLQEDVRSQGRWPP